MKALVYHKPKHVSIEEVADPTILHPEDVIIQVTSTAICGSDLHIYNGLFPQVNDLVMGHEFMGIVTETGRDVKKFRKGDRIIVPFGISCGSCWFCSHHLPTHCESSNRKHYGPEGGMLDEKGGGLFGYTDLYGGYPGGQAQFVRVPYANTNPRLAPESMTDNQLLFLTDIFPTGYTAVDWCNLKGGETVAVFGCGPVGLMAQKVAWLKGAGRVIGVDVLPYRLEMAKRSAKSEVINADKEDVVEKIREMTGGRGADACIEAVGMEADQNLFEKIVSKVKLEVGNTKALEAAMSAVRRGGTVSVVGVYGAHYGFALSQFFDKGLTMRAGQAPVLNYIDTLIELVERGAIVLDDIITHELSLTDAPKGYEIFNDKKEDCVKVVMKP
jgi:S-(hydroxymethyl)glutathione dehydrogenase/alcohol dehydrogenase